MDLRNRLIQKAGKKHGTHGSRCRDDCLARPCTEIEAEIERYDQMGDAEEDDNY